ncbi:hypothetical protein H9Y04_28725 [Streptomyces sp. TRM66268-LWL]|uniref:DUF4352 domain-containing protein n=1 Tax=Streptomyces polyasparticus TaxID=2767826 RepID=A0ABR7SM52_9ACTN|nr:hypothetical protein [Streptomyces polyasparticus]MBC9716523.1 hypothetical protein [Streptomyces polyasparticus]
MESRPYDSGQGEPGGPGEPGEQGERGGEQGRWNDNGLSGRGQADYGRADRGQADYGQPDHEPDGHGQPDNRQADREQAQLDAARLLAVRRNGSGHAAFWLGCAAALLAAQGVRLLGSPELGREGDLTSVGDLAYFTLVTLLLTGLSLYATLVTVRRTRAGRATNKAYALAGGARAVVALVLTAVAGPLLLGELRDAPDDFRPQSATSVRSPAGQGASVRYGNGLEVTVRTTASATPGRYNVTATIHNTSARDIPVDQQWAVAYGPRGVLDETAYPSRVLCGDSSIGPGMRRTTVFGFVGTPQQPPVAIEFAPGGDYEAAYWASAT